MTMSGITDQMYEDMYQELNETIASLRADIGLLNHKLNEADREKQDLNNKIIDLNSQYMKLMRDSYDLLAINQRTIHNLANEVSR